MKDDELRARFDAWFTRTYGDSLGSDSVQYRYAKVGWQASHTAMQGEDVRLWALHFQGPDDLIAAPSKQAAELAAKNFNAIWDAHKGERGHDVRVVANAIKWEHGFIEHAKSVIKHWPEYADLLDNAMGERHVR